MTAAVPALDCRSCPVRSRHFEGRDDAGAHAALAAVASPRAFRDRQTLFVEGHPADRVFFVRSGAVRLTRARSDGDELVLEVAGPGAVLGLTGLFEGAQAATATASGTVHCCTVVASTLRALLPAQPTLALALLRGLRDEADGLKVRLADLASLPAEQRIARFLVDTLPHWQARLARFTQAEIARALALSPETLCRVLQEFRRRGWIEGQGRTLRVVQVRPLARVAELAPADG